MSASVVHPLAITAGGDATTATPSAPLAVDALPYIDSGYDEDASEKEAVFSLISDETKRFKATKDYISHLTLDLDSYLTPLLKQELDRMSAGHRMELMSMKRYEMPAPTSGRLTDVTAWVQAVANSQSQLQHQSNRISNLQLMQKFGCEAWKVHNTRLTHLLSHQQKELQSLQKLLHQINYERKSAQVTAGHAMSGLQETWNLLVNKNYDIEVACIGLEAEIRRLEQEVKSLAASNGSDEENDVNRGNHLTAAVTDMHNNIS